MGEKKTVSRRGERAEEILPVRRNKSVLWTEGEGKWRSELLNEKEGGVSLTNRGM